MCKPEMKKTNDADLYHVRLAELKSRCTTPRQIALERIQTNGEIAIEVLSLLKDGFRLFQSQFAPFPHTIRQESLEEKKIDMDGFANSGQLNFLNINPLYQILEFHYCLARNDPVLYEEIGRAGGHILLLQIIKLDVDDTSCNWSEEEFDDFFSLKDIACEIGLLCRPSFPLPLSPYTKEEVIKRLPLSFPLKSDDDNQRHYCVLINQVQDRQSAQDDVGFGKSVTYSSKWLNFYLVPNLGLSFIQQ